ncbi:glycosyltransferase [Fredinandcohnia humi]
MKKKILFMIKSMNVGGTEKALLNMIAEMPKDKFDITILMLEKTGGFLNLIPSGIRVDYLKKFENIRGAINDPPHLTAWKLFKEGKVTRAFTIAALHLVSKVTNDRSCFFRYLLKGYPVLEEKYDIAIAYAGPMEFISFFVVDKIRAKKRIQWIHFDITKIGFNKRFASKLYEKFDNIVVVSKEGKDKLIDLLPNFKDKTDILHNIVSPELIKLRAKQGKGFTDNFNGLRILTVGRLSFEKGQDIAIKVLCKLIKNGYNVRWYCVGEGSLRGEYENLIVKYNLQDKFILMGVDPNPYTYIDECDIYVQPSRYEGYCITVAEARCLNKPIVTTDVNGTKEQIQNNVNGLIVGINADDIYEGIVELIKNKDLRNKFSENLSQQKLSSKEEIKKITKIII